MKNSNSKNISDLKNANLKKDAVSSIYPGFLTYRSYLSVTEKSNTYDISFPQTSISKNNSVSLNQLKGLLVGKWGKIFRLSVTKVTISCNYVNENLDKANQKLESGRRVMYFVIVWSWPIAPMATRIFRCYMFNCLTLWPIWSKMRPTRSFKMIRWIVAVVLLAGIVLLSLL